MPNDHSDGKFHWTSSSGQELVLPSLRRIKAGKLRKYRKLEGDDYVFTLLEDMCDEDTLAQLDDLDAEEFNQLAEKWASEMGESSGSST